MITLSEARSMLNVSVTDQQLMRRIRRMEVATGRAILVSTGDGNGRRYLVRPDELMSAIGDDDRELDPVTFDDLAARIADVVNAIERRCTDLSLTVADLKSQVAELKKDRSRAK